MDIAVWYLKLWRTWSLDLGCFVDMVGSHNDINMLQCSSMFAKLVEWAFFTMQLWDQWPSHTKEYYLANIINPESAIFLKTINQPLNQKNSSLLHDKRIVRRSENTFALLQVQPLCWSLGGNSSRKYLRHT
jgi:hypothetical protein